MGRKESNKKTQRKIICISVEIRWVQLQAAGNIFSILYFFFGGVSKGAKIRNKYNEVSNLK